ncbi:hypothetical protein OIDMADRAFT_170236 [Oidiodendron maius Zn]|uniref:Uncharacterized protein n=1 Tax=Oidiodendron maius (strain Zn) TaxID=913774 RepID=A0A0C3CC46_OIDMZ|nr:hypothetical protein OIDMADRAFT_170236 [Oidiodendron maius Zn]
MASKCWFVLQQTHYPPPFFPKNGSGVASGPLCLGHLISDLKHLDNIINRSGPLRIPPDMPIYPTKAWDLTWDINRSNGVDVSENIGVPIAAAAGLSINLDAGVAFQRTIRNFWEFQSLESFIFQPTSAYIEDSLEDEEVSVYFKKRGLLRSSSLFMITGIIVARGAKMTVSRVHRQEIHGAGANIGISSEGCISSSAQKVTDFVWAIRLAKISKGLLNREWFHETFSEGATFGLGEEVNQGQQILKALESEGLQGFERVNVAIDDVIFVAQENLESTD